jgi:hypothetical protein
MLDENVAYEGDFFAIVGDFLPNFGKSLSMRRVRNI